MGESKASEKIGESKASKKRVAARFKRAVAGGRVMRKVLLSAARDARQEGYYRIQPVYW